MFDYKKPQLYLFFGLLFMALVLVGWQILKMEMRSEPTTETGGVPPIMSSPASGTTTTSQTTPTAPTTVKQSTPTATTPKQPTSTTSTSSGTTGTSTSGTSNTSSWWSTSTHGSGSLIPASQLNTGGCDYQEDTWSGDASAVGYSVTYLSNSDGNPGSFSVKLDANSSNTEVVGYPSLQCLLYETIPSNLNSSFSITPPSSSNGLDYEFAYDIWLTTGTKATSYNWDNDLELMIWNYTVNQKPAGYYNGGLKTTLSDGSKVYVDGNNTTGIVSVVLPTNITSGNIHIASLITKLKALGYISNSYNGILDVEYGIEAPYGGGKTFTVNSLSLWN